MNSRFKKFRKIMILQNEVFCKIMLLQKNLNHEFVKKSPFFEMRTETF